MGGYLSASNVPRIVDQRKAATHAAYIWNMDECQRFFFVCVFPFDFARISSRRNACPCNFKYPKTTILEFVAVLKQYPVDGRAFESVRISAHLGIWLTKCVSRVAVTVTVVVVAVSIKYYHPFAIQSKSKYHF